MCLQRGDFVVLRRRVYLDIALSNRANGVSTYDVSKLNSQYMSTTKILWREKDGTWMELEDMMEVLLTLPMHFKVTSFHFTVWMSYLRKSKLAPSFWTTSLTIHVSLKWLFNRRSFEALIHFFFKLFVVVSKFTYSGLR